ncbi:unnamed protein product [Amoebophrya sp. A120]|nr:unnamed protein product [Amoebophrya sp. A120]|eukprot:GSA120T00006971001.1
MTMEVDFEENGDAVINIQSPPGEIDKHGNDENDNSLTDSTEILSPTVQVGFHSQSLGSALVWYHNTQVACIVEGNLVEDFPRDLEIYVDELPKYSSEDPFRSRRFQKMGSAEYEESKRRAANMTDGGTRSFAMEHAGNTSGTSDASVGVNKTPEQVIAEHVQKRRKIETTGTGAPQQTVRGSPEQVAKLLLQEQEDHGCSPMGRGPGVAASSSSTAAHQHQPQNYRPQDFGNLTLCDQLRKLFQSKEILNKNTITVEEKKCYWHFTLKVCVIHYNHAASSDSMSSSSASAYGPGLLSETCALACLRALLSVSLPPVRKSITGEMDHGTGSSSSTTMTKYGHVIDYTTGGHLRALSSASSSSMSESDSPTLDDNNQFSSSNEVWQPLKLDFFPFFERNTLHGYWVKTANPAETVSKIVMRNASGNYTTMSSGGFLSADALSSAYTGLTNTTSLSNMRNHQNLIQVANMRKNMDRVMVEYGKNLITTFA